MPADQELAEKLKNLDTATDDNTSHYLLFNLGGELYGTSLLSIKEVIKLGPIKAVPYMAAHFKGVINLRGQIIGVIDLRAKFSVGKATDKGLVLIVETPYGSLGAIIDDLVSVQKFEPQDIEASPMVESKIPMQFLKGIAKLKDRLVNIIDISGCLSAEDLRTVKKAERDAA